MENERDFGRWQHKWTGEKFSGPTIDLRPFHLRVDRQGLPITIYAVDPDTARRAAARRLGIPFSRLWFH